MQTVAKGTVDGWGDFSLLEERKEAFDKKEEKEDCRLKKIVDRICLK